MNQASTRPAPPVVLVVDDEELLRMLATDYFREAGYEVIEAETGEAGLAALRSRTDIRAVFTDVHMPGRMSGLDLASMALRECPGCAIIVVSGREMPTRSELGEGVQFVPKPYLGSDIVRLVGEMIVRRS
jgi:CheY-like chemotaxis protein